MEKEGRELPQKLLGGVASLVSRWEVRSGVTSRCGSGPKITDELKAVISPMPLK